MELSNDLTKKLGEMSSLIRSGSIDLKIINLINIRSSQLNGCTFCNDMHVKEAKIEGEKELRLYHISTWQDSSLFTEKEKIALEWTEAVTKIAVSRISDELKAKIKKEFSEKEISDLTFAIAIINSWNRISTALDMPHGAIDKMYGLEKAGLVL